MMSFLHELRRRNVLRVATTYALAAWIFIEAGSVLLPTFGAPDYFFARVYIPVVALGFIVALVLAWLFEATPDGIRRDKDVVHDSTQRKIGSNRLIIALLVIALGVSITFNITDMRNETSPASDGSVQTIAVLPFENRSSAPDDRYFADGIHDDLLNRLSEIDALRVIAKTSVNAYRETDKSYREIAAELGVTAFLIGSVQRVADDVRIRVQLIDAQSNQHIWGDNYDRSLALDSLFALQSEISTQIATSLQAAISPSEETRIARIPTRDPQAYAEFVRGSRALSDRGFADLQKALKHFKRAIELDADYAQAHARLAETVLVLRANHAAYTPSDAFSIAERHIETALRLDDELAIAHAVNGLLQMSRWELTRSGPGNLLATAAFERALEINHNLADAYVWFASLRANLDDSKGAIDLLTKALQVDPLARIPHVNLPSFVAAQGQNDQATELLLQAVELLDDWETPYQYLSDHLQKLGRLDEAYAWGRLARTISEDPIAGANLAPVLQEFGALPALEVAFPDIPEDHPLYPIGEGYWYFLERNYESALTSLDRLPNRQDYPPHYFMSLMVSSAILVEDYDRAYQLLTESFPQLVADANLSVDTGNVHPIIQMAFIEQRRGNPGQARRLLDKAEPVVRDMPRMGMAGHGIKDVHILTMRGQYGAALDALQEAVDAGYVSSYIFDGWPFVDDPILEPLRNDPRFSTLQQRMTERVDAMRRQFEAAQASGDWSTLLDRAHST